jgi:hypothetical protein
MKQLPDGRWEHSFRQSWYGTYLECPEQSRLIHEGTYPYDQTEAAASGTAVHTAIEAVLTDCADYASALQGGLDTFCRISQEEGFRWVKVKTERTALQHVEGGFSSWYRDVYPTLGACVWVEHQFEFVLHEDAERVIMLTGTVDYAEQPSGLSDWKLTGNADKYGRDGWKLTRAAPQPTFYAAAAYDAGLFALDEVVPFRFVALSPQGYRPQVLPADRTWGHVQFLKRQLMDLAEEIEHRPAGVAWHRRDQSPLCSPKWCLNWGDCKGKHVAT